MWASGLSRAVAGRGPAFSKTREVHALLGWEIAFALGVFEAGTSNHFTAVIH